MSRPGCSLSLLLLDPFLDSVEAFVLLHSDVNYNKGGYIGSRGGGVVGFTD